MDQQQAPSFFIRGPSPFVRLILFSTLSLVLMASDAKFNYLVGVRQGLMTALQPLQAVANSPFVLYDHIQSYFTSQQSLQRDVQRLNRELLVQSASLQTLASLKSENENLRNLMQAAKVASQPTRMAEIMYMGRDPFTQKVIVNVGSNQQVMAGQAVLDANGVLGQVTRVYPYSSEVTLLTDKELAIPIQVERNALRAIAFGDGRGNTVDLPYLPANVDIKKGDKLVTSGIDGVYPAGLAVATVTMVKANPSSPFAQISAMPLAGIQNHRQVLLLTLPEKNAVMKEVDQVVSDNAKKQESKVKNKTPARRGHEN